jgi:NADP-dependent 3-hydroxy acid dehydrogenase YdfG
MKKTQNPVWLITGCATGFGRGTCKDDTEKGWNAIVTARKPEQVQDLVKGYEDTSLLFKLDVTDKDQIAKAVTATETKFGKIDVLVNNAGYGYFTSIEEGEEEKIRAQFETNFFGLVNMTQAVLHGMRKNKSGHIINFSSIGGIRAFTLPAITTLQSLPWKVCQNRFRRK